MQWILQSTIGSNVGGGMGCCARPPQEVSFTDGLGDYIPTIWGRLSADWSIQRAVSHILAWQ